MPFNTGTWLIFLDYFVEFKYVVGIYLSRFLARYRDGACGFPLTTRPDEVSNFVHHHSKSQKTIEFRVKKAFYNRKSIYVHRLNGFIFVKCKFHLKSRKKGV